MHVRHRAALATASLLLALTACGGGGGQAAPDPAPAASDAAPDPAPDTPPKSGTLSAAKAKRLAAAAVLTPKDLPGYAAAKQSLDDTEDDETYSCLGVQPPTYVHRDPGYGFNNGRVEITSAADVVPSLQAGLVDIRAYKTRKARGCLRDSFSPLLQAPGVTIEKLTFEPVKVTVRGADEAFAYRLSVTVSGPGGSASVIGHIIGALVGPVEISVSTVEANSATFRFKQLLALTNKAAGRVRPLV